jgi:hypothetical protein
VKPAHGEVLQGTLDLMVLKTLEAMGAPARLWRCPTHPASFQRSSEAESRNTLSRTAATGATWMGVLQIWGVGK